MNEDQMAQNRLVTPSDSRGLPRTGIAQDLVSQKPANEMDKADMGYVNVSSLQWGKQSLPGCFAGPFILFENPFESIYTEVAQNGGTPKSCILIGFSIINHPFGGTTIYGNPHIRVCIDI